MKSFTAASVLLAASAVSACGGSSSSGSDDGVTSDAEFSAAASGDPVGSLAAMDGVCAMEGDPQRAVSPNDAITSIRVSAPKGSGGPFSEVPITFGQAFAPGDVTAGEQLALMTPDNRVLRTQVDVKAKHPDGSVRHAILSARVPAVDREGTLLRIVDSGSVPAGEAVRLSDLLARGDDAEVVITDDGRTYSANVADLLDGTTPERWLNGPLVSEWLVHGPLTTPAGEAHPRLHARFHVRAYEGLEPVRIGVVLENTWAYQDDPGNVTYDLDVRVNGESMGTVDDQIHYAHSRWHRNFWLYGRPNVHLAHDFAYLKGAGAVPNYDADIDVPEEYLARMDEDWNDDAAGLMRTGRGIPDNMSTGGANPQIGPFPRWAARFVSTPDPRARCVTLGNAQQAGTWPLHYREKTTDRPVSIDDHPEVSLLAGNRGVFAEKDQFPDCTDCGTPLDPDTAHQPSMMYLPYLLTGDYYFLEELHFWANWNMVRANPRSRQYERGLVRWEQVRGQAWSLRTLAETAYITPGAADGNGPEDHPLKSYFTEKLSENEAWYRENYIDIGDADSDGLANNERYANELGWIGGTLGRFPGHISPWQNDFFTWAVGHAVNLGFDGWRDMLAFKARFGAGRMNTPAADGFCWKNAPLRTMRVVADDDDPSGTAFNTFAEVYAATRESSRAGETNQDSHFPTDTAAGDCDALEELTGRPTSATGLTANMRPALAIAREFDLPSAAEAEEAWNRFLNRPNPVSNPSYDEKPQYGISPR